MVWCGVACCGVAWCCVAQHNAMQCDTIYYNYIMQHGTVQLFHMSTVYYLNLQIKEQLFTGINFVSAKILLNLYINSNIQFKVAIKNC